MLDRALIRDRWLIRDRVLSSVLRNNRMFNVQGDWKTDLPGNDQLSNRHKI